MRAGRPEWSFVFKRSLFGVGASLSSKFNFLLQLHSIGVAASISRITHRSYPQPNFTLQLAGLCRFRVEEMRQEVPYLIASVTQLDHMSTKGILVAICHHWSFNWCAGRRRSSSSRAWKDSWRVSVKCSKAAAASSVFHSFCWKVTSKWSACLTST